MPKQVHIWDGIMYYSHQGSMVYYNPMSWCVILLINEFMIIRLMIKGENVGLIISSQRLTVCCSNTRKGFPHLASTTLIACSKQAWVVKLQWLTTPVNLCYCVLAVELNDPANLTYM